MTRAPWWTEEDDRRGRPPTQTLHDAGTVREHVRSEFRIRPDQPRRPDWPLRLRGQALVMKDYQHPPKKIATHLSLEKARHP